MENRTALGEVARGQKRPMSHIESAIAERLRRWLEHGPACDSVDWQRGYNYAKTRVQEILDAALRDKALDDMMDRGWITREQRDALGWDK